MNRTLEVATSFAASAMFGAAGMRAVVTGAQPEKALELYELEGCPFCRKARGAFYRKARAPEQPLELYSFEASPYCRIVREALSELELPYLLHNVAKGSTQRAAFRERSGRMMVPYLVDPNTGREMFESADIVRYLNETYATG